MVIEKKGCSQLAVSELHHWDQSTRSCPGAYQYGYDVALFLTYEYLLCVFYLGNKSCFLLELKVTKIKLNANVKLNVSLQSFLIVNMMTKYIRQLSVAVGARALRWMG